MRDPTVVSAPLLRKGLATLQHHNRGHREATPLKQLTLFLNRGIKIWFWSIIFFNPKLLLRFLLNEILSRLFVKPQGPLYIHFYSVKFQNKGLQKT